MIGALALNKDSVMTHNRSKDSPTHHALNDDHRRLDELFAEVVNAAEAGVDTRTMGEVWTRFETGLRSHLTLEEELVFPALKKQHPDEIEEFLAVHDHIRLRLDTLDVAVDLHFVRAPEVTELVDLVRAHAILEDKTLYRWAESEIEQSERVSLQERLRDRWRPIPESDA